VDPKDGPVDVGDRRDEIGLVEREVTQEGSAPRILERRQVERPNDAP
jgi:hypothetical protein